jgi:hypothetical protein
LNTQLNATRSGEFATLYPKLVLVLAAMIFATSAMASSSPTGKVIAGWVEKVTVVSADLVTKAKLDTGAKTSSIYAVNVENFKRDGKPWTRFDLVVTDLKDKEKIVSLERRRTRNVRIKGEADEYERRSVVMLPICFDGRSYEVEFTLADRGNYIYPVLLGRQFLEGRAIVDSEAAFLTKAVCE